MGAEQKLLGAIEGGGTKFICAVAQAPNLIIKKTTIPTRSPDETFSDILSFFETAEKEIGAITALGIASFGPVDIDPASATYGSILKTPKLGWTDTSYLKRLAPLRAPIWVDTDVSGAGLGEAVAGAGRGLGTIAYVTVGTGIGAGVIKDQAPQSGIGHYELGHIRPPHDLRRDPFTGRCPFHGDCLEGLASGLAIIDRWGASLSDLPPDHDASTLEAIYLSHLALTLILGHMPDKIIFGGGVMKTPGLMEKLRRETTALIGDYLTAGPLKGDLSDYIIPPTLGGLAGITGAIAFAQRALNEGVKP